MGRADNLGLAISLVATVPEKVRVGGLRRLGGEAWHECSFHSLPFVLMPARWKTGSLLRIALLDNLRRCVGRGGLTQSGHGA